MAGKVIGLIVIGVVLLAGVTFGWQYLVPDNTAPMGVAPGVATGTEAIAGVLARADGTPVPGATINVRLAGAVVGTATTAADGTFHIPVPGPNTYVARLETLPAGFTTTTPEFEVVVAPGQVFGLLFPIQ